MLSITRKTDYALVALADLARRGPALASARDLASRLQVPLPALTNILNRLTHRGLVCSVRGANGGYRLARHPDQITLGELIEAVEGPVRLTRCCSDRATMDATQCEREAACDLRAPLHKVHESFRTFLSQVTLRDLAWNHVSLNVGNTTATPLFDQEPNGS
ncbi:MAG: RrF2 family transcriptional regulator [Phycisphaerae bacterium]